MKTGLMAAMAIVCLCGTSTAQMPNMQQQQALMAGQTAAQMLFIAEATKDTVDLNVTDYHAILAAIRLTSSNETIATAEAVVADIDRDITDAMSAMGVAVSELAMARVNGVNGQDAYTAGNYPAAIVFFWRSCTNSYTCSQYCSQAIAFKGMAVEKINYLVNLAGN